MCSKFALIFSVWALTAPAFTSFLTIAAEISDPIAAVGSLGALLGVLLFGWLVYRRENAKSTAARSTAIAKQS